MMMKKRMLLLKEKSVVDLKKVSSKNRESETRFFDQSEIDSLRNVMLEMHFSEGENQFECT